MFTQNASVGGLFGSNRQPPKGPQVIPQPGMANQQQQQYNQQPGNSSGIGGGLFGFGSSSSGQQQQQQFNNNMQQGGNQPGQPSLMQKLGDITAHGGDILSKGKELIFMKFGLGGK